MSEGRIARIVIPEIDRNLAEQGACNDSSATSTELFFSTKADDITAAKSLCGLCVVREECLEGAIKRREPHGVWGGEEFLEGKIVTGKNRKRGPKPQLEPMNNPNLL